MSTELPRLKAHSWLIAFSAGCVFCLFGCPSTLALDGGEVQSTNIESTGTAQDTTAESTSTNVQGTSAESMPTNAQSTSVDSTANASDESFLGNSKIDAKWRKLIDDAKALVAQGKGAAAVSSLMRAATKAKKAADATSRRMLAIADKRLGQLYIQRGQRGDYLKADKCLNEAKTCCDKLNIRDDEIAQANNELHKFYKTIAFSSLGEKVISYLKEAGVSQIAVFRKPDRDLVQIDLTRKYVKPLQSDEVPKVGFAKRVSFEYFTRPNGEYQLSKIQGLTVLAKTLWVNLLDSLLKQDANAKPMAEVTAGKLGRTKTVSVDVPKDVYEPVKQILDNLTSAIKGETTTTIDSATTSGVRTDTPVQGVGSQTPPGSQSPSQQQTSGLQPPSGQTSPISQTSPNPETMPVPQVPPVSATPASGDNGTPPPPSMNPQDNMP